MAGPTRPDVTWPDVGQEERLAVMEYVVKGPNEALLTELLEGFHGPRGEA
jgi:hypothetical protein